MNLVLFLLWSVIALASLREKYDKFISNDALGIEEDSSYFKLHPEKKIKLIIAPEVKNMQK